MKIHPTAIVGKRSSIAPSVEVGPYAIIEDDVKIEKDVKVYGHAYVCQGTEIGEGTQIHMGAVVGHLPQDIDFEGRKSFLKIGKRNIIREYVTIHRGTKEDTYTQIGNDNFFMALSHVGHNCLIGDKITLANGVLLAGYVQVEDNVFISGNVLVHQFCRIGRLAMIGGYTGVNKDVPPYMLVRGGSRIRSINFIGLRRAGFTQEVIKEIKEAFRLIYRSDLNTNQALEKIIELVPGKEVMHLVDFIRASKRGICTHRIKAEEVEIMGEESAF